MTNIQTVMLNPPEADEASLILDTPVIIIVLRRRNSGIF